MDGKDSRPRSLLAPERAVDCFAAAVLLVEEGKNHLTRQFPLSKPASRYNRQTTLQGTSGA
jgi:hypothetical protein